MHLINNGEQVIQALKLAYKRGQIMPNHITNRIKLTDKSVLQEVLNSILDKDGYEGHCFVPMGCICYFHNTQEKDTENARVKED